MQPPGTAAKQVETTAALYGRLVHCVQEKGRRVGDDLASLATKGAEAQQNRNGYVSDTKLSNIHKGFYPEKQIVRSELKTKAKKKTTEKKGV